MSSTTDGYRPQLDGLRAIAVGAVLVQHYWPSYHWLKRVLPWGELGVRLFFVLSGFLIVAILLRARDGESKRRTIGAFYGRRALRLMPVYYLVIGGAALLAVPGFREHLGWHAAYASNLVGWFTGDANLGGTTHLWSLAVEEQFYAVAPWLILLLPARWIGVTLGAIVAAGVASRGLLNVPATWPVMHLDALGVGAMLAWTHDAALGNAALRRALVRGGWCVGLPVALVSLRLPMDAIAASAWAWWFASVVDAAATGVRGPVGGVLGSKPMTAIGRISYGIYVYHFVVPFVLPMAFAAAGAAYPSPSWELIALWTATTLVVATLSWWCVERPVLALKKRLPYRRTTPVAGVIGERAALRRAA